MRMSVSTLWRFPLRTNVTSWTTATVVLITALAATASPGTVIPVASISPQAATDCPDAAFIGVYGTQETSSSSKFINDTWTAFDSSFHGGSTKKLDFDYGTIHIADYGTPNDLAKAEREVSEGASKLDDTFTDYFACSNTTFYLAGYSAGAWIIDKFLSGIGTKVLGRVGGVVLYGDPQDDQSPRGGMARTPVTAINSMPAGQVGSDRVRSYCLAGDPICGGQLTQDDNVWTAALSSCVLKALNNDAPAPCTHFDYDSKTSEGGQFLAGQSPRN